MMPVGRSSRTSLGRFVTPLALCLLVTLGFVLTSDEFFHWFLIPTILCGVLAGADALDWFCGRVDVFDPKGILGLLFVHRYFLSPFLHLHFNHWIRHPDHPADWRPWLGWWGMMNVAGLLVYCGTRAWFGPNPRRHLPRTTTWRLEPGRFSSLLALFLVVTFVLQAGIYLGMGGIEGYVSAYENRLGAFDGLGWLLMIAESFPILAMMGYAAHVRQSKRVPSWQFLFVVLVVFLALKIFFGGIRGSRVNTLWGMFWALGIIHFWIRPVPKKLILTGIAVMIPLVYAYGFYKAAGRDGVAAFFESAEARASMEQEIDRPIHTAYLGGGTQIFTLYRLCGPESDYQYAYGRTYAAAFARLIPKAWWPDRPEGKLLEGTELFYGRGSFPSVRASQVWGLMGEAMLNFGPFVAPLAFAVLGFTVGRVRRAMATMGLSDSRWMLMPLLVTLCVVVHSSDSENILFFLVKEGTVPLLLIGLGAAILTAEACRTRCGVVGQSVSPALAAPRHRGVQQAT
jgi:hypothetical protein